jgi:tetratricopeptide (TPR) repeat protein
LAQEDPVKAMKKATRDLGAYNLDPSNNLRRLQEAKESIDFASMTEPASSDVKTWIAKGQIYNALASNELGVLYANPEHVLSDGFAEILGVSVSSFEKALGLATKKFETRDALDGLKETFSYLSAFSNQNLGKQNYAKAYPTLLSMLNIHNMSLDNGGDELLVGEDLDNNYYVTAFCAMVAEENEVAIDLFSKLVERGTAEAAVYSNLFSLTLDKDEAKALALLDEGKAKYPGNTEILFAEINYYLKEGKLDDLVSKLELAIEKEPDNISLYTTLGNVYDNLFQRELESGNKEQAAEYFDKALKYYDQALQKDPAYFDAIYSIGALYYNKAAALTVELKALESDLSREGMRKFNEKEKEVFEFFDKALPYFQGAEKINPNDQNTLIALREIYARKNEMQISEEFRKRIERIAAGESNESYFAN